MLKSLRVYLLGASDQSHATVGLSITSAGRALEMVSVESKNTLMTVTSSVVSPLQPGLLQAQLRMADLSVQSVSTVAWAHPPEVYACYHQSCFIIWAWRQTALRARPIKYSGIQLPQGINRGLGYLCTFMDLDRNDLS